MAGFDHSISIVLKVKNAAQAKKEIDSVISNTTLGKVKGYNKETRRTDDTQKKVAKSARQARSGIKQFTGTVFSSLAVMALFNRALRGSINLFDEASSFERVGVAFEQTVGKMTSYLPELRRSTRGVVDDMNLLKTSTRAVTEGLGKNQLSAVFKQATVASRKLGLSTKDTINTITKAITRHDESAMTTLGIIMKNNKAYQMMQNAVGAIKGPANAAVKIQLRHAFVMQQLTEKYGSFNSLQMDSLEILNRARATWTNFRIGAGKIVVQVLSPLIKGFTGLLNVSSGFFRMVENNESMSMFVSSLGSVSVIIAGIATTLGAIKLASSVGLFSFLMNPAVLIGGLAALSLGVNTNMKDIEAVFSRVALASSVFFQLLGNYNDSDGMTSVLSKDKKELGSLYGLIFNLAKGFKVFQAVGSGILAGIAEALMSMGGAFAQVGGWLGEVIGIFTQGKPVTQDFLNSTKQLFQTLAKYGTYAYAAKKSIDGITFAVNKLGSAIQWVSILMASASLTKLASVLTGVTSGGIASGGASTTASILGSGAAATVGAGVAGAYSLYQGVTDDDYSKSDHPSKGYSSTSNLDFPVGNAQSEVGDWENGNEVGKKLDKLIEHEETKREKLDIKDTKEDQLRATGASGKF